jgi:hypothetical protein
MWPKRADLSPFFVEVLPSRWDEDPVQRSRAMFAGLAAVEGLSFEFVVRPRELRFYFRAASAAGIDAALDQLRAAYNQAALHQLDVSDRPHLDPGWMGPGETCSIVSCRLSRDSVLPLFTGVRSGDPLPGVLAAAAGVTGAERIVSQLVLSPAPRGWQDQVQGQIAVRPRYRRDDAVGGGTREILPLMGLLGLSAVGLQGYEWYQQGQFLAVAGLGAASVLGAPLVLALASRFLGVRDELPADLLEEKLAAPAFTTELRILAFGSAEVGRKRLNALASRVAAAYQAFDHPLGNGLRPHRRRGNTTSLRIATPSARRPDVLNAAELAVLWHLPTTGGFAATASAAAHQVLPSQNDVGRGCRVGVSAHQGHEAAAYMPSGLLFRNHLIVAKTRRGKSTLLIHQAAHLMQRLAEGRERLLLVVVDPHQDLAETVLGLVPPGLEDRVAHLNLADRERPVGLNLLDVPLFPDRDRTAENVVTIMHRLWPDNWGPRMEGALRASIMAIHEANQARRREEQYTLLDVVPMLSNEQFRQEVLKQVPDRTLWAWWRDNFNDIGRVLQQQTANPVTTKVGRFLVTQASRLVLGQPVSTFDPRPLLKEGGVLVVNSAVGLLGEGASSLVGATVLNLLGLVVEEQVALPPSQRSRMIALVDESSTLGAADYPRMLSELGKYGASFVLVTQSLAKLDAVDDALRPTLFSNIDGLTVFQVSAQDARYLAPELGGELDVPDLTSLDDFECYARWWAEGRRLPAFSLRLDPPPPTNPDRLREVIERSAERYGRPREQVAREIEELVVQHSPPKPARGQRAQGVGGQADQKSASATNKKGAAPQARPSPSGRNQHRGQVKQS